MPTFDCEKCKEGSLEFEIGDGDNGDPSGPYFESFSFAELVEQTCKCVYTEAEMQNFEEAAMESEWIDRADAEVDAYLGAHGF